VQWNVYSFQRREALRRSNLFPLGLPEGSAKDVRTTQVRAGTMKPFTDYGNRADPLLSSNKALLARFSIGFAFMLIALFGPIILGFYFIFTDRVGLAFAMTALTIIFSYVLPRPVAWLVTLGLHDESS
jgi:hypothetical protein